MIEAFDFVVFLDADWHAATSRNRQHFLIREVARQIERSGRVLAVERPVCPITGPWRRSAKFVGWLAGQRGVRQESPNLFVQTPFILLHNVLAAFVPGVTTANRRLLRWQVMPLVKRLGFRRDRLVAWIHHPYQLEDVGLVSERVLVYDCYDNYLANANGRRLADLRRRETGVIDRADVVLAASESLQTALHDRHAHVHLVPNGVEPHLFSTNPMSGGEPPPELAVLPHPLVGFLGQVAAWLDFELLGGLAELRPEWTFAFVGSHDADKALATRPGYRRFRQCPNVHLLGPKRHADLPPYLNAFDVCIIPYRLDGQVPASSPIKLYEYLAAGKPVVSVPIPHVSSFQPLVKVANTAAEFERSIELSLSQDGDTLRAERLAFARQNSWDKRAEEVLSLVAGCL
jgi:glycosyltransferase involved in cell wall biosynthesis